jgi:membrane dipeptidase
MPPFPVFDGHNDILSKLAAGGITRATARFRHNPPAAIDLARANAGGFAGGFFAVWVPSRGTEGSDYSAMSSERFSVPLPPEVPQGEALGAALTQIAILMQLERDGALVVCRSVRDIERAMADGRLAAILHMEGAEAIDSDLVVLDVLHAAGLRSLGPVWSRPNRFGHGVPFRYPSTPDTGPGLTADGLRLVARCNELGVMLDVSHLTEAGFWDVVKHSKAPVVATHSNAHALCATARNLTDLQLDAIRDSDGMVGINFATAFLREDGRMLSDVPLERILQHADHLVERLGEDRVGLGSDYDGAVVPESITGVESLPKLTRAMLDHGYDEALIRKLCHGNWMRVLRLTWGG